MNIKNFLKISLGLATAMFATTSCVHNDDWETPPINCTNRFDAATKTMAEVMALAPASGVYTFPADGAPVIIDGYVVSSDENGNFYKTISFQDKPENPTVGLQIEVDRASNFADYPAGSHIRLQLNGLVIGRDRGVVKIGSVDPTYLVGRIPSVLFSRYVSGVCSGSGMEIATLKPLQLPTLAAAKNDKYLNMLVTVPNVQFASTELPKKTFADIVNGAGVDSDRNLEDSSKNTAVLRTSGFASFAAAPLPEKSGDITFVVSKYNANYQMIIRSLNDINFTKDRFTPVVVVPPVTDGEAANFMFKGADFENWNDFLSSINTQFGIKSYAVQAIGQGRDGSNALALKGTPTANDYVFTSIVNNTIPAAPKKITLYIKGTAAGKSLSFNVNKSTSGYTPFNLGNLADQNVTLVPADANQYTGSIDTKGKWVLVTLNVEGLDIQKGAGKDLFSVKTGSGATYDLVIDNIKIE